MHFSKKKIIIGVALSHNPLRMGTIVTFLDLPLSTTFLLHQVSMRGKFSIIGFHACTESSPKPKRQSFGLYIATFFDSSSEVPVGLADSRHSDCDLTITGIGMFNRARQPHYGHSVLPCRKKETAQLKTMLFKEAPYSIFWTMNFHWLKPKS